jgi:hypothetical protein
VIKLAGAEGMLSARLSFGMLKPSHTGKQELSIDFANLNTAVSIAQHSSPPEVNKPSFQLGLILCRGV